MKLKAVTYLFVSLGIFLLGATCVLTLSDKSNYDFSLAQEQGPSTDEAEPERQLDDEYLLISTPCPAEDEICFPLYYFAGDTTIKHVAMDLHCPPPNFS